MTLNDEVNIMNSQQRAKHDQKHDMVMQMEDWKEKARNKSERMEIDGSEQKGNQVRNLLKQESEEFFKIFFSQRLANCFSHHKEDTRNKGRLSSNRLSVKI